jgi:sugar transferase (PEP-CTERM/EpsH1 system associated)
VKPSDDRPLVLHLVHRFAVGGLENGVVNLVNGLDHDRWRHAVVALTDVDPAFSRRLQRPDVPCLSLQKPPGQSIWQFPQLWHLFRALRPSVVHTRNLAANEMQIPAWLARVPGRVHSEHGRDIDDVQGTNRRHILMRRLARPFVGHYIALSRDLSDYLQRQVAVPPGRVTQIYNGVDAQRFSPAAGPRAIQGSPFNRDGLWLVGTVGRMVEVKAQTLLTEAFIAVLQQEPALRDNLRLVLVGDGPLRAVCAEMLAAAGMSSVAWLPGERADVPEVMRGLNCFALPSLVEGVSNTILEAMASGLPVVATSVGGNADLVVDGETGLIVPSGRAQALVPALLALAGNPGRAAEMGRRGRMVAVERFSLPAMVAAYQDVYDRVLGRKSEY